MTKWVYSFGGGSAEGEAGMRNLLGGKGANLAEMSSLGLPVPPGFTITTEACNWYYDHSESYPGELTAQVDAAVEKIGEIVGTIVQVVTRWRSMRRSTSSGSKRSIRSVVPPKVK